MEKENGGLEGVKGRVDLKEREKFDWAHPTCSGQRTVTVRKVVGLW